MPRYQPRQTEGGEGVLILVNFEVQFQLSRLDQATGKDTHEIY